MAAYATFHTQDTVPPEYTVAFDRTITKMVADFQQSNYNTEESEAEFCFAIRPLNILV